MCKCDRTAKEGPVRIQYKCLVPVSVFPEMKLLFPQQKYNVLSPSSFTHISVRDIYISRICLPILLQGNMWTNPWNIYVNRWQTHVCGNWDWGRAIPRKGIHKWDFLCSAEFRQIPCIHCVKVWIGFYLLYFSSPPPPPLHPLYVYTGSWKWA